MSELRDVVIIGSGPAGLTAAIYAARANLTPLVFEGLQPGGQLTITTEVENFPGFAHPIEGPELMDAMREQAVRVGTEVRINTIESVDLSNRPFTVKADDGTTVLAKTLIICTGASAKWIGIESEVALQNRGVSACATCDGFFFRGKDVIVVGGGDTAMEEAMYLTRMCNSVTVIHRRDTLRASKVMADRALANPKIRFEWNSAVKEIKDVTLGKVTGVVLESTIDGSTKDLACDGVFVAIGHQPNTGLFKDQLPMDANGYLVTDGVKTNVDGCFAAGDVWDTHYRQAVTAAGMGCQAAIDAIRFIEANEH
ncbi:MAG: thioredoxin-disulfide reductase [Armatimonadaceae bacterium]|jgi:thioredoxin reductase (NADPH)